MTKKILVFDDERSIGRRWKSQLEAVEHVNKEFSVETVPTKKFEDILADLEKRRRDSRQAGFEWPSHSDNPLDSTAVLFIDYDLLALDRKNYITGETIAYLARCYSRCGLIVGVNAYGENSFDLTLRGHPESYADINLGSKQISASGLWSEPWKGFRPWYWPLIPEAARALERRAKGLIQHLDESIFSYLGIPEDVTNVLPRSTTEFIAAGTSSLEETTFRSFVEESRSNNGLRRKDKAPEECVARIAAARIGKWLERLVLPGQDILVDAPHLVSRYPSLLKGNKTDLVSWNRIPSLGKASGLGIQDSMIRKFQFVKSDWLSRPAWFWSALSNYEKIKEVASPWRASERPSWVFCEDISLFLPRNASREFVADLPSQYVRRFVTAFNAHEFPEFAKELKYVDYTPQGRLAL